MRVKLVQTVQEYRAAEELIAKQYHRAFGTEPLPLETQVICIEESTKTAVATIGVFLGEGLMPSEHLFDIDDNVVRHKCVEFCRWAARPSSSTMGMVAALGALRYAVRHDKIWGVCCLNSPQYAYLKRMGLHETRALTATVADHASPDKYPFLFSEPPPRLVLANLRDWRDRAKIVVARSLTKLLWDPRLGP